MIRNNSNNQNYIEVPDLEEDEAQEGTPIKEVEDGYFEIEVPDDEDEDIEVQETEETEDELEETESADEKDDDEEVTKYASLVENFNKYGLEINDEDLEDLEEITDDSFKSLVSNKITKAASELINNAVKGLADVEREMFNHILEGGKVEDMIDLAKAKDYSVFTDEYLEENTDDAKNLIIERLISEGRSEARAKKYVDKLEEDEIYDEAIEARDYLESNKGKTTKKKTIEERRREEAAKKKQAETDYTNAIVKEASSKIDSMTAFIPNTKLQADTKTKIKANVLGTLTKVIQNADKYAATLALLDHYGILEGDFSKVTAPQERVVAKKLREKLETAKKPKKTNKEVSDFDIDDFKRRLKGK